jgi:hypothetical protein
MWNNYFSDTLARVPYTVSDVFTGPPYPSTHIVADRDYYNSVSKDAQTSADNCGAACAPFNGTTGMGFGTLLKRPTTCTTGPEAPDAGHGGVGYWATDQGEWDSSNGATPDGKLYRCTATNTWAVHYTPYTYPHPLQGALTPPAPGTLTTAYHAAFRGPSFIVFVWSASTDPAHKAYNVYRCSTVDACSVLVKQITPASAAAAHSPETQFIDSSLYTAGTYYYSVSDVNTQDYVGPATTPVGITVTGKQ